jgi:phosphatidylethanolamine/phosphatidyl-N-methylethanolamine N-methyltransferase
MDTLNGKPKKKGPLSEWSVFFLEFFKSWNKTASVAPSSPFLARALCRPIDFQRARVIVELGPGTGAITAELLRRMAPDAALYAFDINAALLDHARERFHGDSRFVPILGGAETIRATLGPKGVHHADAVVSSLGLTSMPDELRSSIVDQVAEYLGDSGVYTQYQYPISAVTYKFKERDFLKKYFHEIKVEHVMLNLPPADVFACRR